MNLSELEPLQVMLSSRCSDKVMFENKLQEMSVLRRTIKSHLESLKIGDVSFLKFEFMKTIRFSRATLTRGKDVWKKLGTGML